jgi:hypothetical protein
MNMLSRKLAEEHNLETWKEFGALSLLISSTRSGLLLAVKDENRREKMMFQIIN